MCNGGAVMSFERAKAYLEEKGYADRIIVPEASTATVELAAQALGTEELQGSIIINSRMCFIQRQR